MSWVEIATLIASVWTAINVGVLSLRLWVTRERKQPKVRKPRVKVSVQPTPVDLFRREPEVFP